MNKEEILRYVALDSDLKTDFLPAEYDASLALANAKLKLQAFLILEFQSIIAVSTLKISSNIKLESKRAELFIHGKKMVCNNFSLKW